jgi:hypothetical protein
MWGKWGAAPNPVARREGVLRTAPRLSPVCSGSRRVYAAWCLYRLWLSAQSTKVDLTVRPTEGEQLHNRPRPTRPM